MKKINQVVILCGGKGTRLGNLTKNTPKPLIKVGKKPFLEYLLENISRFGFKEIILLISYKSEVFIKKYHKKKINNTKILCKKETKPRGTGGALIENYKYLDKYFLLLNGDTYFETNFINFISKININKYKGLIALKKIKNKKYGGVNIKGSRITSLSKNNKKSNYINAGLYLFDRSIFKTKDDKKFYSLEEDLIPKLIKKKKLQANVIENNGLFIDIGTIDDLKKSKFIFSSFKRPTVLLDRDGVINEDIGYLYKKKNFVWRKNIVKTIKHFNDKNYFVFVVTNQSGIGRGFYTERDVIKLHKWINEYLYLKGAYIDDFFYAPYFVQSKKYSSNYHRLLRKPNVGMVNQIKKKWPVDTKKFILFGDKKSDMALGKKINAKNILIKKNSDIYKLTKEKKL